MFTNKIIKFFRYINPNNISSIFDRTFERKVTRTSNIRIENDIYKAIDQNGRKVPLYSNNIIVHKILLDDSLYIKSWITKYILIKDKIQWNDSNELKDETIGLLKDEIFKKIKK
ncbi:MAG: hypothetical protein K2K73_02505 [Ureaplasma sp.]|nr:hypothetical protein [Ureaplasma sp.]